MEMGNMPLTGEYEPNPVQFVRDQVELYETSGGTQGTTLSVLAGPDDTRVRGLPVVILTTLGAKTGKIRKSPLMRVKHDGCYAVVASWPAPLDTRSGTTTWQPTPGWNFRTARYARTCWHAK
jgi:hypothetical protein